MGKRSFFDSVSLFATSHLFITTVVMIVGAAAWSYLTMQAGALVGSILHASFAAMLWFILAGLFAGWIVYAVLIVWFFLSAFKRVEAIVWAEAFS